MGDLRVVLPGGPLNTKPSIVRVANGPPFLLALNVIDCNACGTSLPIRRPISASICWTFIPFRRGHRSTSSCLAMASEGIGRLGLQFRRDGNLRTSLTDTPQPTHWSAGSNSAMGTNGGRGRNVSHLLTRDMSAPRPQS